MYDANNEIIRINCNLHELVIWRRMMTYLGDLVVPAYIHTHARSMLQPILLMHINLNSLKTKSQQQPTIQLNRTLYMYTVPGGVHIADIARSIAPAKISQNPHNHLWATITAVSVCCVVCACGFMRSQN